MMQYFKKLDWILIVSALLLVGFGLLSLYSSSLGRGDFLNFKKQIIFAGIAFFLMFAFSLFNHRILRNDPYLILILYLLCILALVGLLFFAPAIRGVKSWYRAGPISVDPVGFTELILIILLAKFFSLRHVELYGLRHIFLSGFYILIPAGLVSIQPNLGSALVLIALWIVILLVSGIRLRPFLILFSITLLILILSWFFVMQDYQKERIWNFLFPQSDLLSGGWHQNQSKIAIGSGGILGQGFGRGSQTQYGFLPEVHTDFIFAAIAEEFGFLGVSILLILFSVLIFRIIKIAVFSDYNFSRLFALGLATILIVQLLVNVGMNLGLLPIVGIPLPLISYGGSNLFFLFISFGILQSIRIREMAHIR